MFGENVRNTLEGEVYLGRTMFGENVRNTCWRERYTRDDVKRTDNVLERMLETLAGGTGILGMMLRGRTMFCREC